MPRTIFEDPNGTLEMLRASVALFAQRHPGPATLRAKRAAGADLSRPVWSAMTEAGWTGLLIPEAMGGLGLGLAEQAVLSEALGRALVAEPLAMTSVFPAILLVQAPVCGERDRLLSALIAGEAIVAPAWLPPPAHSRAEALFLRPEGAEHVLSGEAHFVEAARAATDLLIVCKTAEGAALVSLPAQTLGITLSTREGVDGAGLSSVHMDRLPVANAQIIATGADLASLVALPVLFARIAVAAELAGLASRALELTIDYTRQRIQFGKPIASFQAIQHRLVEMWSDVEFACAAVVNAVETYARGDRRASELAAMAAKARAGDAATSICRRAVHLHGAMGITDESDIGLYLKRAINLNATLGQPEALRLQFIQRERAA